MNKLTIPALLLGVVMVAGAFAFMPVQEASTVHTTSSSNLQCVSITLDTGVLTTGADDPAVTETFEVTTTTGAPFIFYDIELQVTNSPSDDGNDLDLTNVDFDGVVDPAWDIADFLVASDPAGEDATSSPGVTKAVQTIAKISVLEDTDDAAEAVANYEYKITVCAQAPSGTLKITET